MNEYRDFAAFYDVLTEDVDYTGLADYIDGLIDRHGGRRDQLLDLACGSGSLSLALAEKGAEVVAVDGSPDMLAIAREKAAEAEADILFLCQDMRRLDLYGTVDTAVCMLDSLNHILKTDELAEIFRRLGLFIAPDGLLIFDANTPHKHRETLGNNAFVFETPECMCVWRNALSEARCEVVMQLDFFLEEGAAYSRYTDEVRERAYALSTWKSLLEKAGFTLLGVYGDRSLQPPSPEEDRWFFVARNRAIEQRNDREGL